MENKAKTFILVLACFLTLASATQNLCNEAKAKGLDFAADPSDCTRYLYCERDSANPNDETNIVSVYYMQCSQDDTHKYFKDGHCVTDNSHCPTSLDLCPPSGKPDYKIANRLEATICNENRYCRLPGMAMSKCETGVEVGTPGTFQFDRNTGTCVDNTDGIRLPNCTASMSTGGDPCKDAVAGFVGYVGKTSPTSDLAVNTITECDKWYFCYEQATYDSGTCSCGEEFGTADNPCKLLTTSTVFCTPTATGTGPCPAVFQSSLNSRHLRKESRNLFL